MLGERNHPHMHILDRRVDAVHELVQRARIAPAITIEITAGVLCNID